MEKRKALLKYAACGALAGLASGFFGGGGGMLLVPLFIGWCKMPERRAFATALSVMLPVCMVSAGIYLLRTGAEGLGMALPYLAGGLLGGIVAGLVFPRVSTTLLRRALALFILYGGVRSLLF